LNSYFPIQGYINFLSKVILLSYSRLSACGGFNWVISRLQAWRSPLELLLSYPRLSYFPIQGYLTFLTKVILFSYSRLFYFPIEGYFTFLSKVILLSYPRLSASGGFNWMISRLKAWRSPLEFLIS